MKPAMIAILLTIGLTSIAITKEAPANAGLPVIKERFVTALEPEANIDSVAVAAAREGEPALLFATAKATDVVKVFDASSGAALAEIGGYGVTPDFYQRPNGIAVVNDLLLVVERDNRRVSIRSIPDYRVLGTFGDDVLRNPYGLWVQELGDDRFRLFVTDAYEMPDESVPPPNELGERVKQWQFAVARDADGKPVSIERQLEKSFGATDGAGVLQVVESIFGDPQHDRLLIAEEDESPETGLVIKVYNLDGQFTGTLMGRGIFKAQAEGIALYACEDGTGYWLSTDQSKDRSIFHVFDRQTLQHVGAFTGSVTANTDGIWLAAGRIPRFETGAFFAVHDDQAVSAFDWSDIVSTLGLNSCG